VIPQIKVNFKELPQFKVSFTETKIKVKLFQDEPPKVTFKFAGVAGPQGPAGPAGAAGFSFTQPTPSALWTINHNLGYDPVIELFSIGGLIIEGSITNIDTNTLTVAFNSPYAGSARLI
jgi:hypothetical protein